MRGYIIEAKDKEPDDEYIGGAFVPHKFASEDFALSFSDPFDAYIELRVLGVPRDLAAIEAFEMVRFGIDLQNADQVGMACDVNPYYKQRYPQVLASKDVKRDMWSERESVNQLLRMVKDPRTRDNVRLNAIVQLNIMCEYVKLDELTARRVDKTISEFKRQNAAWVAAGSPTTTPPASAATH